MPPLDLAVVPWYTSSEQYELFRSSSVDRDDFFVTYDAWREAAMEHECQAARRGIVITRIRMDYQAFETWAAAGRYRNDSAGRSAFAEYRALWILT